MKSIFYRALAALTLFLLGVASTWAALFRSRAKKAENRATVAEAVAREAASELEEAHEAARIENLSDEAADKEARELGVLSNRSPRKT